MISIAIVFAAIGVAYIASALTVPAVVRIANSRQLFDFPDRDRHGHPVPVPRLGGVAVFSGLAAAVVVAKFVDALYYARTPLVTQLTFFIAAGCILLFLLGLWDDIRGVPALAKLAAQTVAALAVIYGGFRIEVLTLPPDITFSLGVWSIPVTVLWLVGVSNALNLVDGMDGLAGGVTIVALCVTTGAAIVLGNVDVTWQTFALIGAVLGFLRYNAPPARIFLGDSGSLVVGFLLAVLTVKGATRLDGATFALAPVFALSYPLLDTGIAIMRRFLRREPLSRADGRHIHHQLRAIGLGPRRSVAVILFQSALVGLLGLGVTFAPPKLTVAVACAGLALLVFIFAYGLKWLQYHEFLEAGLSLTSAIRNSRTIIRDKILARDIAVLIGNATDVQELRGILHSNAASFRFDDLDVKLGGEVSTDGETLVSPSRTHWRIVYPIAPFVTRAESGAQVAYLIISCPMAPGAHIANPERVARILAPAIGAWLDEVHAQPGGRMLTPPQGSNSWTLRRASSHTHA